MVEAGHIVDDGASRLQQRPGYCRARAFAQAHAKVKQRLGVAQGLQHQRVAAFARFVGKNAALQHQRVDACSHQQCRANDKAIDQNHAVFGGSLQECACHGGNLEAAQGSQHIQRLGGFGVCGQCFGEHLLFVLNTCCAHARACARALGNVVPCQPRQYERGGRGIAYAHFAKHDGVAWQRLHQFAPVLQRLLALRGSHGGLLGAVGRAVGYFAQAQFGVGLEVVHYAAIGHGHVDVVLAGKYAYGSAASQKVFNHLPGYVLRHASYAVAHQPVVARADQYLRLLQHGAGALQNHADLHRQRFKPRQRALRLGFVVDDGLQLGLQCGVLKVGDGGEVHGFFGGWWGGEGNTGAERKRRQSYAKGAKKFKKMGFVVGLVIATRLAGCLDRGLFKSDNALIYFSGKTKL